MCQYGILVSHVSLRKDMEPAILHSKLLRKLISYCLVLTTR